MRNLVVLSIAAIGFGSAMALAQADQPRLLATYFNWRALTAGAADSTVCYVAHLPGAVVQAAQRDEQRPLLLVAWRPAKASANVVTYFPAYRFKPGADVVMQFAPRLSFKLFTARNSAWVATSQDDATIVQAMRDAYSVTVRGTTEAGVQVADTILLTGFTAAAAAAVQACPPR